MGVFKKLARQAPRAAGAATVFPILSKTHGNPPFGLGVSEHVPGKVDLNLNYDEAIYLLEGDLKIVTGDETYELAPGEVLWMPRGVEITYVSDKGCKYIYVTSPAGPNT